MSSPDGSYGQTPYRPAWESGPPGVNQPGGGFAGQRAPAPDISVATPGRENKSSGFDPAKLLGLAVAGLGGLNFIWGFLPELTAPRIDADLSVFAVGPGYVPVLLLIAGLLALAALLPGSERSRLAVAAVSVGGAAGAIVSLGTAGPVELLATGQVSKGLGAILLVVFGIIQAVVAIAGYVVGADFSQRAPGADTPAVSGPAAAVQPGWIDPSAGVMPAGYASPLGTPPGSLQPGAHHQTWWPPAPLVGQPPLAGQAPLAGHAALGNPDPSEAVTGPQVVIGAEQRRDGDTGSPPGGVPGRQP